MNQAEVLCHSSGPWKKHKYFQKIGEGANAVYKYSKKAANSVTGSEYKDKYWKRDDMVEEDQKKIWDSRYTDENGDEHMGANKDFTPYVHSKGMQKLNFDSNEREKAKSNYYNKSLAGKVDKAIGRDAFDHDAKMRREKKTQVSKAAKATVAKGEQILKNMFKTKTTITVTSNLMPPGTKKTVKSN